MISGTLTKADLRRAVIRTAARAKRRHDRTGTRAIAAGVQDNDGWASEGERFSTIAFARQQASSFNPISPAGHTPCFPSPETSQRSGMDRRLPCAPAGAEAKAFARNPAASVSAPVLSGHSLHNGDTTHG